MSARRIDKVVGITVLVLAVVLALLPLFIGSPSDAERGSIASSEEHGRRALFLLVQELGLTPEAWNQPPGRLPRGEHLAWLARAPEGWKERQPKKAPSIHSKKEKEELKLPENDRAGSEHKELEHPNDESQKTEGSETERTPPSKSGSEPTMPRRTTPEQAVPERTSSERTDTDRADNDRAGTDPIGRDRAGSDRTGTDRSESERTGSDRTDSDRTGSDRTGSDRTGSDRTDSDRTGSDRTGSERTGSERTGSERTGSERTGADRIDTQDEERAGSVAPEAEDDSKDATPAALGAQTLSNYRRFVEEGGTLVMRYDERARRFLSRDLALEEFRALELDTASPAGERRIHTESGEDFDVDWPKGAVFRALAPNGPVRALWTAARSDGERDEVLAVIAPVASGHILLLGDDAFLDNVNLGKKDHALLAVRLAEHRSPGGRLLFDEFALGLWHPETATSLATSPQLFLITAHLALLAFLFVWARSWVGTFPRDPEPLARVSPLSRARARAALCERARRYDLLAGMLRRGAARRWLALARLRPLRGESAVIDAGAKGVASGPVAEASGPEIAEPFASDRMDVEGSASDPTNARRALPTATDAKPVAPDSTASEIARIAVSIGMPELAPRWRELALERRVENAVALESLSSDLDRIEGEIQARERRTAQRAG